MKITKRSIDAIKTLDKISFFWDDILKGFGVKITPAGSKIYIAQYRIGGRGSPTRRFTIGKHGVVTPDEARKEAKRILGDVAKSIDPQTLKANEHSASTISELCDVYLKEGCTTKKPSTIATDTGRIERHIKPLIGRKKVKDLTHNDVRRFMADIAAGKTAARVKTGKSGLARVRGWQRHRYAHRGAFGWYYELCYSRGITA